MKVQTICLIGIVLMVVSVPGFAQEAAEPVRDVMIRESRFSTTAPVIGDSFQYSLKFDYVENVPVHPVEHFAEQGIQILEQQRVEPQRFDGRIIEQYEYTLQAGRAGDVQFSPVELQFTGPRQNPIAAITDPVQLTIVSVVDIQVESSSPVMIGESLELQVVVTKRKPVTITGMPQELQAALPSPKPFDLLEQQAANTAETQATPTATPTPEPLRFSLDQAQQITPRQVEGAIVEEYAYVLEAAPQRAGEYALPAFHVSYRTAQGEEIQQSVEEHTIFVLNPSSGNLDIQTDYRFLVWPAIIAVALLFGGASALLYMKYRKPRQQKVILEPMLPPGEVAHRELAEIQAMQLPSKGEFKQYYSLLSEAVRKFLGAEYHFHVLERTTEEILAEIDQRAIPENVQRRISMLLPESDMVKFAKYVPTLEQAGDAMEQAVYIVDKSLNYHQSEVS